MSRLPVPMEALSQHVTVLGKTRSGKSSKMRVLVEWLLEHKKRVVIITPKDDWWGLRSHADGRSEAFPIVIFGGRHEDVPLNPRAGAQVAELIATGNRPCLITFFRWPPTDRTQFYNDFMAALFAHHRGELYVVIDEVHNFAPKGKVFSPQAGMMLHWSNTLASEGQGQGLIMLAASQRPQKVHNDLLTSCETLIACRVIHKADRDAIKDWIDGCADPDVGKQVLADLATMKREDAWCWSPEIGFGPKRVTWPMFATYDSFKPQEARSSRKLKGWAEIDLEEVRAKLQSVVAEAEANDPKKLKARIAELEREVAKKAPAKPLVVTEDRLDAERRGFERGVAATRKVQNEWVSEIRRLNSTEQSRHMAELDRILTHTQPDASAILPPSTKSPKKKIGVWPLPQPERSKGNTLFPGSEASKIVAESLRPKGLEQRVINALAWLSQKGIEPAPRETVAAVAGVRPNGGYYSNVVGKLKTGGYITYPSDGVLELTPLGVSYSADPDTPGTIHDSWLEILRGLERKIVETLIPRGREPISREELAAATNTEAEGSYFSNVIGHLKTLGAVEYPQKGQVALTRYVIP